MGDGYLACCGTEDPSDHALRMLGFAEAMLKAVQGQSKRLATMGLPPTSSLGRPTLQIRIGMHTVRLPSPDNSWTMPLHLSRHAPLPCRAHPAALA